MATINGLSARFSITIWILITRPAHSGLKYAASKGLAVVVMEPLHGGKLAADLPALMPILAVSQPTKESQRIGLFSGCGASRKLSLVLSGMNSMAQLEENLTSAETSQLGLLNEEEREMLGKARQVLKRPEPDPLHALRILHALSERGQHPAQL